MTRNVLVAQSGGPSPVINASLYGVIEACREYPEKIDHIYAAWHGIEGVLMEELIDMSGQDEYELSLLPYTPCSGSIGTCRYKLKSDAQEDYERIIEVLRAHDIGYFFYIGGNDSMDTADKVSRLAREKGYELIVAGVPKTIDNDLGDEGFTLIDHTPGYGSCARYWAYLMQNADEENRAISRSECVSVYQAMGRQAGFITAASRLGDPERKMPLRMFFAETGETLESAAEKINDQLKLTGRCIAVVNEGLNVGEIGARHDLFGHIEYGASTISAAQALVNYLNSHHLSARGQATGQIPGTIQRGVSMLASVVDIEEAQALGRKAVEIAMHDGTGFMSTILRADKYGYYPYYSKTDLSAIANSERHLPKNWISDDGTDVTNDFMHYARPLIGNEDPPIPRENGLQRFAHIKPMFIDKKCSEYKLYVL